MLSLAPNTRNAFNTRKKLLKNENGNFLVAPYFTRKLEIVSSILFMVVLNHDVINLLYYEREIDKQNYF